jgi:hypothetical protein
MSRTRRIALAASALLALTAAAPTLAQNTIYQWVDANGVTHFSGQPPEGQAYEERVVTASSSRTVTEEERQANRGPSSAGQAAAGDSDACTRARANLALLEGDQVLTMDRDGDGVSETITLEERQTQLALAQTQVTAFCQTAE